MARFMILRGLLTVLLIAIGQMCTAQADYKDDLNNPLSDSEMNQIHSPPNSAFRNFARADSFSYKGDRINAGKCLLQIDPYYFIFLHQNPDSIGGYISKRYKLPKDVREKYVAVFDEVYTAPKSEAYLKFKEMADEDQEVRHRQDSCKDSTCFSLMRMKMAATNIKHFEYLDKYIIKNGWPSIADGSLYASILAVHDHEHHEAYIPLLKKSVLEGQVEPSILRLVNYWYLLHRRFDNLREYIAQNKYFKFDVSSMIHNEMPDSIHEIEQIVREHCPVATFIICECSDSNEYTGYGAKMWAIPEERNVLSLLNIRLAKSNCNVSKQLLSGAFMGCWDISPRYIKQGEFKIFLYVTYDRTDTALQQFNKLIRDKKFITHPIHFEENKSEILPGDIDFLKQLVAWLRQNPLVKLELDGHASNEGNDAANMKLSISRGEKVKKQLIAYGIDKGRLIVVGFGATQPVKSNDKEEGKNQNRRVEFIILK